MTRKIVFMYSGQGSQYFHMGRELFENNPAFREEMYSTDDIIRSILGESILERIYSKEKKKSDSFDRTLHTHPAIFMVENALTKVLLDTGIIPDYLLGASMGEFASAACSGVLGLEEIVEIIVKQAQELERCPEGGMLAILEKPGLYENERVLCDNSELAAINYHSHIVVSGRRANLDKIISFLKQREINYQLLPVSQAFHSSLIDQSADPYINYLKQRNYQKPRIPLISCTTGDAPEVADGTHFWEIVRRPIFFQDTIRRLENGGNNIFIDLGPSGTLATFVKYNLEAGSDSKFFSIITPFGNEVTNLKKLHDFLI